MSDLISKSEEREWIKNWFVMNSHYHPYAKKNTIPIGELYDILERMPTIDPAENGGCWGCQCALCGQYQGKMIQGDWIYDKGLYRCSACNNLLTVAGWGIPEEQIYKSFKFCPNCGAKMDLIL